ncbi:MAG TPA: hypothetical protein LFW20_02510 [Rickettsia endosymbiont of Omalisus fontisbellaquei]|nr:hypothetical protein [Rickettsia endosymbiont of Omalisus fontisbellaquei]
MYDILIDTKEAVLAFLDSTDLSAEYTPTTPKEFNLLDSGELFTSAELATPTTIPSDDSFTVIYNTAVKLVSSIVGYVCSFFWGSK